MIGLAQTTVTAVDSDPLRLAMALENIRAYERIDRVNVVEGDVLTVPIAEFDAAFCDPDRRADGAGTCGYANMHRRSMRFGRAFLPRFHWL